MRIDLHTHSVLSDGTDRPEELVRRAAESGVTTVALTDHDHADGWPAARAAASRLGLDFVPGIEISTSYRGSGVHLLAYYPDPARPALRDALARIRAGRAERISAWVAAGERAGISIDEDRLRARVGGASVSKNHVADLLLEQGVVSDREAAFTDWLADGKPLYVRRFALPLTEAIGVVRGAGGVPVVAHPLGRRSSRRALTDTSWPELVEAGLAGVEVDHRQHDTATRAALRDVAARYDLIVTGSSDYHGTNKTDHELGCEQTAPEQLDRIRALAEVAK